MRGLLPFLLLACGARSGLDVDELAPTDAGIDARDARVADTRLPDVPLDVPPDVPACDEPPCECFAEGSITWEGVYYCGTGGSDVRGCGRDFAAPGWGEPMQLEASCRGRYTVCASVEALSGCQMAEVCADGTITNPDLPARVLMPSFLAGGDDCTREALEVSGAHTCLSVRWRATDGTMGSMELGCFARFGPFCFGVRCGGGGGDPGPGAGGMWEF